MSYSAALAYLRALREYHNLSQEEVGAVVGVSFKQISRWETGEHHPPSLALARFIAAVNGIAETVQSLLIAPDATPDDGLRAAEARIAALHHPAPPDTSPALFAILERLEAKLDALADDVQAIKRRLPPVDPDA